MHEIYTYSFGSVTGGNGVLLINRFTLVMRACVRVSTVSALLCHVELSNVFVYILMDCLLLPAANVT